MAFRKMSKGFHRRRQGPRYYWKRISANISPALNQTTFDLLLTNGDGLGGIGPGSFFEGQEVLLKAMRFEVHVSNFHSSGGSAGDLFYYRHGIYIDTEAQPGLAPSTIRDVNWSIAADSQVDWLDVWCSRPFLYPAVNTNADVTKNDEPAEVRNIRVSRRVRSNQFIGYAQALIPYNTASSFGTGVTTFGRLYASFLVKHLRNF